MYPYVTYMYVKNYDHKGTSKARMFWIPLDTILTICISLYFWGHVYHERNKDWLGGNLTLKLEKRKTEMIQVDHNSGSEFSKILKEHDHKPRRRISSKKQRKVQAVEEKRNTTTPTPSP